MPKPKFDKSKVLIETATSSENSSDVSSQPILPTKNANDSRGKVKLIRSHFDKKAKSDFYDLFPSEKSSSESSDGESDGSSEHDANNISSNNEKKDKEKDVVTPCATQVGDNERVTNADDSNDSSDGSDTLNDDEIEVKLKEQQLSIDDSQFDNESTHSGKNNDVDEEETNEEEMESSNMIPEEDTFDHQNFCKNTGNMDEEPMNAKKAPPKSVPVKFDVMTDLLPSSKTMYLPRDLFQKPQNALTQSEIKYKHWLYWQHRYASEEDFPYSRLESHGERPLSAELNDSLYRTLYALKREIMEQIRDEISLKILTHCFVVFRKWNFSTITDAIQVMRKDCFNVSTERTDSVMYGNDNFGPSWERKCQESFMEKNNIKYRQWQKTGRKHPKGFIAILYSQVLNNSFRKMLPIKKRKKADLDENGHKIVRKNKYKLDVVKRNTKRVKYVRKRSFKLPVNARGIVEKDMIGQLQKLCNEGFRIKSFDTARKAIHKVYKRERKRELEEDKKERENETKNQMNAEKTTEEAQGTDIIETEPANDNNEEEYQNKVVEKQKRKRKKSGKKNKHDVETEQLENVEDQQEKVKDTNSRKRKKKKKKQTRKKRKKEKRMERNRHDNKEINETQFLDVDEEDEVSDMEKDVNKTPQKNRQKKKDSPKKKKKATNKRKGTKATNTNELRIDIEECAESIPTLPMGSPANHTRKREVSMCHHEKMLETDDYRYCEGPNGLLHGTICTNCGREINRQLLSELTYKKVTYCKWVGSDDMDHICKWVVCGDCNAKQEEDRAKLDLVGTNGNRRSSRRR